MIYPQKNSVRGGIMRELQMMLDYGLRVLHQHEMYYILQIG